MMDKFVHGCKNTWSSGRSSSGSEILSFVAIRLKADLFVRVYVEVHNLEITIGKTFFFKVFEREFLQNEVILNLPIWINVDHNYHIYIVPKLLKS